MKARTTFEKQVERVNTMLADVSPKAIEWAVRNLFSHPAFRLQSGKTTCGDCGQQFQYDGKAKNIVCPHCGRRLEVKTTLNRTQENSVYYAILDTIEGLQVERVYLVTVEFKKGRPMNHSAAEVCRLWLNATGQTAVTSRARSMGYYRDCFNWGSPIVLRGMSDVHYIIANTWIYPRYKAIPELRRNGLKGSLEDVPAFLLMKGLLTDTRIETLMKAGNHKAVKYFLNNSGRLDRCWNAHKIAMRHGYTIEDYGLWCDLIELLEKCGRDTRSTRYICPADLKAEHDLWLHKNQAAETKRIRAEKMIRAKEKEADFYKQKSCFFGILIKDEDIEISVLDSLEAYQAEGDAMHHCVFQCEYYAKENSVILSAHDKAGNRIETIEFSLTTQKVVQSRGLCNKNSVYHDRIVNLVNSNAHLFLNARASA